MLSEAVAESLKALGNVAIVVSTSRAVAESLKLFGKMAAVDSASSAVADSEIDAVYAVDPKEAYGA
jgi:hypothetical protein